PGSVRWADARPGGRVPGHRAENSRPRLALRPGLALRPKPNIDTGGEFAWVARDPGFFPAWGTQLAQSPAGQPPTGIRHQCQCWAWFKSLGARVTLFSMEGGVVPAVNDGRARPSRQSGLTLYTAKCYPGLNQAQC